MKFPPPAMISFQNLIKKLKLEQISDKQARSQINPNIFVRQQNNHYVII